MKRVVIAGFALCIMSAGPAYGHAARVESSPEEGSKVAKPPAVLTVDYAEPPAGDPTFNVTDGCGRAVVEDVKVENQRITATLAKGSPGQWQVRSRIISAVDGHEVSDQFGFTVAGKKDCKGDAAPPVKNEEPPAGDGGGSTGVILIVGAATVVLVAIALVLRRSMS